MSFRFPALIAGSGLAVTGIVVTALLLRSPAQSPPSIGTGSTSPAVSASPSASASVAPPKTPAPVDPGVAPDFHPQVASVVEAQRTGKFPERLSLAIAPKPFDPVKFAARPQEYLNTVEPGRVFQTAAAGPDAVPLIAENERAIIVPALGSTSLSVRGKPNAPVSWTILDGGVFAHNRLASTTVLTNAEGVATVTYQATPGTIADVQILVGSPLMVGTLTMVVQVAPPPTTVSQR